MATIQGRRRIVNSLSKNSRSQCDTVTPSGLQTHEFLRRPLPAPFELAATGASLGRVGVKYRHEELPSGFVDPAWMAVTSPDLARAKARSHP